jgi:hypothetical protein
MALVSGAVLALALPGSSGAQVPTRDSVVGSRSGVTVVLLSGVPFIWETHDVSVDVSSGPAGESPTGNLSATFVRNFPQPSMPHLRRTWSLTSTCLSVSGKTAIVGFTGRLVYDGEVLEFPQNDPVAGLARVVDNGGGESDTFEWAYNEGAAGDPDLPGPTTCAAFPGPFPVVTPPPLTIGHIAVVDAPAGCEGREPTVAGTTGNETLVGTPGDDVIVGLDGDDVILGGDGNDAMFGGDGNDFMLGQADTDALFGGPGDDALAGNDGDDVIVGGLGTNACDGGAGTNTLVGC